MVTNRLAVSGIVILIGSLVGSERADAASYGHIGAYATRVRLQSVQLAREFRAHFRHTEDFDHLMSDSRDMIGKAAHIETVARTGGSPYHLLKDIEDLDRLFHHTEDLVARIDQKSHFCRECGHVHGNTQHLKRIIARMEDTLHHLSADVRSMQAPASHHGYGQDGSYHRHRDEDHGAYGQSGGRMRNGNARSSFFSPYRWSFRF